MFEPLFKRGKTAVQVWQIRVEPQDDGTAIIVTTHGQLNGAQQEARDHIREGKNAGKKNATTARQQAVNEAQARWQKQRDRKHYGLTVEESAAKKIVAPMLAHGYRDKSGQLTGYAQKIDWRLQAHMQPKFDGHRCLIIHDDAGVKLYTRQGTEVTTCDHIAEAVRTYVPRGTTLDGELYTHGVAVTTIGGYIKRKQEGTEQLRFMAYDLVDLGSSFGNRFQHLSHVLGGLLPSDPLEVARTQRVTGEEELLAFQAECVESGYEGAILRHGMTAYEPGARSGGLLKVKTFIDGEVTIVGCQEGRGKFEGAAIFECLTADGHPVNVTAPGDMPTKQQFWHDRAKYIGKRLTIKYQKMTETANPVPFQPVAKCIAE